MKRRQDEGSVHSTGIQLCMKDAERNEHIWSGNRIVVSQGLPAEEKEPRREERRAKTEREE